MRTPLQVQRNKIVKGEKKYDKAGLKIKDYIISTLPIINPKVMYLNKDMHNCVEVKDKRLNKEETNPPKSTSLPTDDHPYDHFLILGQVKVPLPLIKVYHPEYKLKYTPSELTFEEIKYLKELEEKKGKNYFNFLTSSNQKNQ